MSFCSDRLGCAIGVVMKVKQGLDGSPARPPVPLAEIPKVKTSAELKAELERSRRQQWRDHVLGKCPPALVSFAAGVSALVYHPFEDVRVRLQSEGASGFRAFDRGGTQAVAFRHADVRWLVFRGSESHPETEMFLDWGHDLFFLPWGLPPRHSGFARAWRQIRRDVLEWIATEPDAGRLVITGHSLGGALGITAADEIAQQGIAGIEAVVTFGAPRVGTWPWSARYHKRTAQKALGGNAGKQLRDVTWRIYNDRDIVTHVPPLAFKHCGTPISATMLQRSVAPLSIVPSPMVPIRSKEPGTGAWLTRMYREKKGSMPVTPVTLIIDLLLAITESAPEHFMRHYSAAFPDRPFSGMAEPVRTPSLGPLNGVLKAVKAAIAFAAVAGLAWVMWKAYQMSPELTILALAFVTINIVIEFAAKTR